MRLLTIDQKRCKLQVWDTIGQERFQTVRVRYPYKGANAVVVVFDVTNKKSFENVNNWICEVEKHCAENTPCIIVGNKTDLVGKREVSREEA